MIQVGPEGVIVYQDSEFISDVGFNGISVILTSEDGLKMITNEQAMVYITIPDGQE